MPDPAPRDPVLEAYQRQAAITMGLANVIAEVAPDVDDWVRSKLGDALRLACAQSAALTDAIEAAQADQIRRDDTPPVTLGPSVDADDLVAELSPEDQRLWRMDRQAVTLGARPYWTIVPGDPPRLRAIFA